MVLHITQDIKDIKRFRHIIAVFFEEGLGHYLKKGTLRSHLKFLHQIQITKPLSKKEKQAQALRHAFERLGPTFVKLGQLLSLRPDLVPIEYAKEFECLQDQVPPFSYVHVKKIIEEELQQPLEKTFKSFNKTSIASASIAQVHEAVLKNGKRVAVKVQRPDIQETIDLDLDILFFIAHYLEKHFPKIQKYHPVNIVKEFALWTRKELNFEIEMQSAIRLKEELKHNKHVYIPKMCHEHSTRKVLMMEFVSGINLGDLKSLNKHKINRKTLAENYFISILEQTIIYGFFHADPHPGNILVSNKGKSIYLDYGIMGELSNSDRKKIIQFIHSIPDSDPEKSFSIMLSLARDTSKSDIQKYKEEAIPILKDVYTSTIQNKGIGQGFFEILTKGAQYNVVYDPAHILMAKAVYQAEGIGLKLDPGFKISNGMAKFADIYLKANYSPTIMAKRLKDSFIAQKNLLLELPEHISKIIKRLETPPDNSQEIAHLEKIEKQLEHNNRRRNEIFFLVSIFGLAIFLFYLEGRRDLFGFPLSGILFILGAIFTIFFIITNKKEVARNF
ncbi:AarF/ABC1/UbiB kinase family protein [Candidatus Woesearchaeota archaeon]|nr:AarF/ABC1/UbiB kinase family protein [Candidatus Woesearchaeota archaeon]